MIRINRVISAINGIPVLFLTGAVFTISFRIFDDLALPSTVSSAVAWLIPAIIDAAIIVFNFSV